MALSTRETTPKDATLVAAFVHALLSELDPGSNVSRSQIEATTKLLLSESAIVAILAFDNETPLGVIVLNECAAIYAGGKFGEISELYVEPEARSAGIASTLLSAADSLGRSKGWKRLEVGAPSQPKWERTLAFYERENFTQIGPRLRRII